MKKRGQFTTLVVFGVLALVAIGIVLMARSAILRETAQGSAEEALSDFLRSNAIRDYVEACLKEVSEQGVALAGLQGGKIWNHQGGSWQMDPVSGPTTLVSGLGAIYLNTSWGSEVYNVSYVVEENGKSTCAPLAGYQLPPDYPWPNATIAMLDDPNFYFSPQVCPGTIGRDSGFYGTRTMPLLCQAGGPNQFGSLSRFSVYSNCDGSRFDPISKFPVQYQLKAYAEKNLPKCTDFTNFKQARGASINVINSPVVEFTYGATEVFVNASYPVQISMAGRPPVNLNAEFYHRVNGRFKELYEFYWDLILNEIQNSSFNPMLDYAGNRLFRNGFRILVAPNICPGCIPPSGRSAAYDDLLGVMDTQSMVQGQELAVLGMIKNRPPVLEPLSKIRMVDMLGIENFVDIATVNSSIVVVRLNAVDADDDQIVYGAFDWKVSYSKAPCTSLGTIVSGVRVGLYNPVVGGSTPGMFAALQAACLGAPRIPVSNPIVHSTPTSNIFTIAVGPGDVGLHNIRFQVTDGNGVDYQDVSVLVVPQSVAKQENWKYCISNANPVAAGCP